jgi:hypothetical protein
MADNIEVDGVLKSVWREMWGDKFMLHGFIYDDRKRRFKDSTPIHTSLVIETLAPNVFKTMNSIYRVESWRDAEGSLGPTDATYLRGLAERIRVREMPNTTDIALLLHIANRI